MGSLRILGLSNSKYIPLDSIPVAIPGMALFHRNDWIPAGITGAG